MSGFPGCAHKSFKGLEAARTAWRNGPTNFKGKWTPPAPRPAKRSSSLPPLPPTEEGDDDEYEFPVLDFAVHASPIQVPIRAEDYQQICREAQVAGVQDVPPQAPSMPPGIRTSSLSTSSWPSSALSTPSWMSSGSLSPGTVHTPDLTPAMGSLTLGERYADVDHALMRSLSMSVSSASRGPTRRGPNRREYTLAPGPMNTHPGAKSSAPRAPLDKNRAAKRLKGDPVFIVVRGEQPGVYFDLYVIALIINLLGVHRLTRLFLAMPLFLRLRTIRR